MFKRPRRAITKPLRYTTTSSDEEVFSKKRKVATPTSAEKEIQEDIQDIRRNLKQDPIYFNNNNNYFQYSSLHTNIQPETNIQPHIAASLDEVVNTNLQSHKPIPSNTNLQSHIVAASNINHHLLDQQDTIVQPHVDNQAYTHNTQTRSYINLQPCSSHNTHVKTQSLTPNYDTLHVEKISYADNAFIEFQDHCKNSGTRRDVSSQNWNVGIRESTAQGHQHHSTQPDNSDIWKIHERLDRIEAEMKRVNSIVEKIFKCVQNRHRAPQKPAIFPIASLPDMDAFEKIDEDGYSNAVNYFCYIGGFNLREAVNICLKESLKDTLVPNFTWWGREGHRSLYDTRLIMAIYDSVCQNKYFEKPTRSEFQVQMREALRMSKERHRSRSRRKTVPNGGGAKIQRRDLWNDGELNESTDQELTND